MEINSTVTFDSPETVSNTPTAKISTENKIQSNNSDIKKINSILNGTTIGEGYSTISEKAIADSIKYINKVVSNTSIELLYSVHKDTNTIVIKMRDKDTNDIVKEIPPEKLLNIFVNRMKILGLYFDERV